MKGPSNERAGRGRAGAGGRAILRPAFRDGWLPFIVHLWTDVAIFSAAACAVVFAVLSQDPGGQAAAASPGDSRHGARSLSRSPLPPVAASTGAGRVAAIPSEGMLPARRFHAPLGTTR